MSIGFRMTVFSDLPKTHKPDTKVDGFPSLAYRPNGGREPSPLAIVRERLFLNSGSGGPFGYPDMRRFVNGGDGSRNTNSRRRTFRSGLSNGVHVL